MISIISMIVSQKKLGLPKSEDDLIDILKEKKILSPALAKNLKEMKGLRNILVHRYTEVDDQGVYRSLSGELADFSRFEKELRRYLRTLKETTAKSQRRL